MQIVYHDKVLKVNHCRALKLTPDFTEVGGCTLNYINRKELINWETSTISTNATGSYNVVFPGITFEW